MRVAIIKSNYSPYGGGEKYATRMIKAFVEKGIHVDVLTADPGGWEDTLQDVGRVRLKQSKYNNLLRLLTFNSSSNRYLKKERYDCVFGMDRTEYQTHLRAGGGCHAAWLRRRSEDSSALRCLSFRINPFHMTMLGIERRAFTADGLKRIFCNSNLARNDIIRYYPQVEDKIMVVHNGVEWHEFSGAFDAADKKETLKGLGLYPDRYYFLFVGSGFQRKGLGKAITALNSLPRYVELLVVGKDKNENRYRTLSRSSGLGQRVHFFGPLRDVLPFLRVSDAFILPTLYDPFSNASIEALAMGLYTVTSSANGCSEVIREGAGHVIEDIRDSDSVSAAMKTALKGHLSREQIRESVRHLDFGPQLNKIVNTCLGDMKV